MVTTTAIALSAGLPSVFKLALTLTILATSSLLVVAVALVSVQAFKANWAYFDFKRKSKGLFIAKDRNLICNHAVSLGLRKDILNWSIEYYKEHGQKTYGWLLREQFGATTFDPNVMKRIILDDLNKNVNRLKIDGPASEFMEDSIMIAEDDQWRRLRRAVAPALRSSKFKVPNVLDELNSSIDNLIEAIEHKLNTACEQQVALKRKTKVSTLEVDETVHRFTLDVVFRVFYKQYDLIDFKAKQCLWTELVDEGLGAAMSSSIVYYAMIFHALRKPIDWFIMNFHRQGEWRSKLSEFIKAQTKTSIEARKQLDELKAQGKKVENEDDFLLKDGTRFRRNMSDHMVDHLLDGKITQREYFNTTGFLINAADKTTADALVHLFYCLSIDLPVQDRLRKSIQLEGSDSVYLEWVINESMRLLPSVPVACSRKLTEDLEIEGGHVLPAGTFVNYPSYIVHRLEEYWGKDANEFRPERWADTSNHHPLQFVPFGAGVRACPGREFALFEIRELLSRLLLRYKFTGKPKEDAYTFDSPFLVYILYNSPTFIEISRV